MKKLVSTTLALAMLAAPVGVMASSADQVSENTVSTSVYKSEGTEKPKKSHKLRNALIIGATVAGVAVISVATHKAVSKACITGSENKENKVLSAFCDTNSKVSEISTKVVNFVSDHVKSIYENGKSLFVRKNAKSPAEAEAAAATATTTTTVEEQQAIEGENTSANA